MCGRRRDMRMQWRGTSYPSGWLGRACWTTNVWQSCIVTWHQPISVSVNWIEHVNSWNVLRSLIECLPTSSISSSSWPYSRTTTMQVISALWCNWWRSIVVRTSVLAGGLSLSCTGLMDGCLTTLWVRRPVSVNQQGQLSLPSLRGRLNE